MTIIQDLQAAGLVVQFGDAEEFAVIREAARTRPHIDLYAWVYTITKPPDHPTFHMPPAYRIASVKTPLDAAASWIGLHFNANTWEYRVWDTMPGPHADEFSCLFPTRALALAAVADFYLGRPRSIDGWVIPLHRHPEMHQAAVLRILKKTIHMTKRDYREHTAALRHQYDQLPGTQGWPVVLGYQFIECPHDTDPHVRLCLRRDLQEAFVVEA